jgi:hypothetical protein
MAMMKGELTYSEIRAMPNKRLQELVLSRKRRLEEDEKEMQKRQQAENSEAIRKQILSKQ